MTYLSDLKKLALAATPGPYYVALDDAEECGPHRNSGLSLVDTGRTGDWPIARLCETQSANLIAACSPERVLAMLAVIEAAKAMREWMNPNGPSAKAFDAAIAAAGQHELWRTNDPQCYQWCLMERVELTDADWADIERIAKEFRVNMNDAEEIFRAGLAAGRARVIEEAATVALLTPEQFGSLADDSHKECAIVAARLIRALNATQPKEK